MSALGSERILRSLVILDWASLNRDMQRLGRGLYLCPLNWCGWIKGRYAGQMILVSGLQFEISVWAFISCDILDFVYITKKFSSGSFSSAIKKTNCSSCKYTQEGALGEIIPRCFVTLTTSILKNKPKKDLILPFDDPYWSVFVTSCLT